MKNKLLLCFPLLVFSFGAAAQQKIKDGSVSGSKIAYKDALLELESNDKGLLHARVALTLTSSPSPLATHVAGMMVYNTVANNDVQPGIYYNDGTKWIAVKGSKGQAISIEDQSGKTGAPGVPGNPGGPVTGTSMVTNDSGAWLYNPLLGTWTNINGKKGDTGADGKSAYDIYKAIPGNENKTPADFAVGLKGDKGDTGADGKSSYDIYKAIPGNENKTPADFAVGLKGEKGATGADGKSAYDIYKAIPGNENKTPADFAVG
ncbi:hypothetical protein OQX61_23105, partial [Pedobacter sp. PLR]|nr:hypothetical protein [Pedobacter sp. PLR]